MTDLLRARTEAPSEPGWYYCREKEFPTDEIFPMEVGNLSDGLEAFAGDLPWPLDAFDWFGPVPTCGESGT